MTTGNNAQQAAEEQQRRERQREELTPGIDFGRKPAPDPQPPEDGAVDAARMGAVGILGEL